jgi:hypothetical protein
MKDTPLIIEKDKEKQIEVGKKEKRKEKNDARSSIHREIEVSGEKLRRKMCFEKNRYPRFDRKKERKGGIKWQPTVPT